MCGACGKEKSVFEFPSRGAQRCRDCTIEWAEFREGIDKILDADRPARAGVNETVWRERAYAWARNHMPNETMLTRQVAVEQVNSRETKRTRRGNDWLRSWDVGQLSLTWEDIGFLPVRIGDQHVRLDNCTPGDFRRFANETESSVKKRSAAEMHVVSAARELERRARAAGCNYVKDLGDLPPRGKESGEKTEEETG